MPHVTPVMAERVVVTRADHQTHRSFVFDVPDSCTQLDVHTRYTPKFVSTQESDRLVRQAVSSQVEALTPRVGSYLAQRWAVDFDGAQLRVPNLLTISLDDAAGAYRGAGHRHTAEQQLTLGPQGASPGLVAGPLPAGRWTLTLTAHTVVSDQCEVEIQIGAVIASSRP
jgi:hypothetical protein